MRGASPVGRTPFLATTHYQCAKIDEVFEMFRDKRVKSLTDGPIFFRILLFAFPIMVTGLLQTLYNMADNIVVGQFSGDVNALGAVGSTGAINSFILNIIVGISGGAGVAVAHYFGAKENERVSRATHTAMTFSVILGIALTVIGLLLSRPVLTLIGTKPEYLEKAILYLRIICLGLPASSICNFAASILRSTGDAKSPMIILSSAGIINVMLNLFFVIVCNMAVDGVAIATIISQYVSAILMVFMLVRKKGESYTLSFSKLRIDRIELKRILRLGVPAGIQGSLFSLANIVLTNGVNTFSPSTVTAYTITNNIDSITFIIINSFQHASTTFTGQNFGAKRPDRIKKILLYSLIQVSVVGILVGQTELFFGEQLCSLYIDAEDPNRDLIISTAISMMQMFLTTYFLCGIMEVLTGVLRGLGYSVAPMIMALTGACGFRIFWRFLIFPYFFADTPLGLLISFPISWILTITMMGITLFIVWKKTKRLHGFDKKPVEESEHV